MKHDAWKKSGSAFTESDRCFCEEDAKRDGKRADMQAVERHSNAGTLHMQAKAAHHIAAGNYRASDESGMAWLHEQAAQLHGAAAQAHKNAVVLNAQGT